MTILPSAVSGGGAAFGDDASMVCDDTVVARGGLPYDFTINTF